MYLRADLRGRCVPAVSGVEWSRPEAASAAAASARASRSRSLTGFVIRATPRFIGSFHLVRSSYTPSPRSHPHPRTDYVAAAAAAVIQA